MVSVVGLQSAIVVFYGRTHFLANISVFYFKHDKTT